MRSGAFSAALRVFGAGLAVLYPAVVYLGLVHGSPRLVAFWVLALAVPLWGTRLWRVGPGQWGAVLRPMVPTVVLMGLAAWANDERFLLAVPVLVSLSLLLGFAVTLRPGATPMIERFARMYESELPPQGQAHCRRVTWVWCGFFVINAAIAAAAAWIDVEFWALYTGVLAYAAIAALLVGEYLVRKIRFRRYGHTMPDRLLAAVFPPRPEHGIDTTAG